jgi:hypothetical protein
MTRKVYRTAQGKMVDLGALQLRNENVRAVGNMGVNARGDLLDSHNRPINTRNQQVAKSYNRQTNVTNQPVFTDAQQSQAAAPKKAAKKPKVAEPVVNIPPPPEDFDDDFEKPVEVKSGTEVNPPATGLAAAIARARQIKQEPLKTPRQLAQDSDGVKKL